MKKTFLALFFILFAAASYAQMPIILESELQKLREEAASKSQSDRTLRARSAEPAEEEQTEVKSETPVQTQAKQTPANKTATQGVTTPSTSKSSSANSDYIKRYRERQQRIKNSK
ncbi:MAG: hypothetical protein QM751_13370 [Paludibacteraceae bacterium]